MNISLSPELAHIVQSRVDSGLYSDASEVMRDALRRLDKDEEIAYQHKLEKLREALEPGLAAADRGDFVEYPYKQLMQDMDDGKI